MPCFSFLGEITKHPWTLNLVLMLPFLDLVSDYVQLITAEGWDNMFLTGAIFFALSQLWRIYIDSLALDSWLAGGVAVVIYRLVKLLISPMDIVLGMGAAQAEEGRCCAFEFEILDERHLFDNEKAYFRQLPPWDKYYQAFMSISAGARWYTNAIENGMAEGHIPVFYYWRGALVEEVVENIGGFLMAVSILRRGDDQGGSGRTIALVSLVFTIVSAVYETGYLRRKVKLHGEPEAATTTPDGDEENKDDEEAATSSPPTDEEQRTTKRNPCSTWFFKMFCNLVTLVMVAGLGALSIYTLYEPVTVASQSTASFRSFPTTTTSSTTPFTTPTTTTSTTTPHSTTTSTTTPHPTTFVSPTMPPP